MVLIRKTVDSNIFDGFNNVYFTFEKLLLLQKKVKSFLALSLYTYISFSFLLLV